MITFHWIYVIMISTMTLSRTPNSLPHFSYQSKCSNIFRLNKFTVMDNSLTRQTSTPLHWFCIEADTNKFMLGMEEASDTQKIRQGKKETDKLTEGKLNRKKDSRNLVKREIFLQGEIILRTSRKKIKGEKTSSYQKKNTFKSRIFKENKYAMALKHSFFKSSFSAQLHWKSSPIIVKI